MLLVVLVWSFSQDPIWRPFPDTSRYLALWIAALGEVYLIFDFGSLEGFAVRGEGCY